MAVVGIALCALLVLGVTGWVFRLLRNRTELSLKLLATVLTAGAVLGIGCHFFERAIWRWTGLGLEVGPYSATLALVAMMAIAVPLEEASKLVLVFPLYARGRLQERADGVVAALVVAAGFAVAEGAALLLTAPASPVQMVRVLLGSLAHLFFAGTWGFVLSDVSGGYWLRRMWVISVVFHGLFDHIVFGRGVGTMVLVGPLLLTMALLSWLGLKDARREHDLGPATYRVGEGASLNLIRGVVRPRDEPLMLRWIVIGALVTTGVALFAVGLSIYAGHQIGVDFAAADESDVSANAPLLLLGSALMLAFPFAGYLIALASATNSVLEPALGAALAIVVVMILLSLASPVAIVFSLAVAPVAFGLACVGAWFGMGR